MTSHFLHSEQRIPSSIERVFAFFADPRNLEILTPPWLHFAIVNQGDMEMRRGLRIDYRLRLHRIPMRWQSEITAWDPPHRFVDEQRRGPYRLWIHEHTFEQRGSETIVRDRVEYAVPGGLLINSILVAPDLDRIFRFRRDKLADIFG